MGSPYINRFIQPDTVIPDLSNPQAWNRYSYVLNSPIIHNDPTGHKYCAGEEPCEGGGGEAPSSGGGGGKLSKSPVEPKQPAVATTDLYEEIKKLEESESGYTPHTLLKHAPESPSGDLLNKSLYSKAPQTKFTSSEEMVDSIMQTIDDKLVDINQDAEFALKGQNKILLGQDVGFEGYDNGMFISGRASVKIVIKFDGDGGWFLFTAFPAP